MAVDMIASTATTLHRLKFENIDLSPCGILAVGHQSSSPVLGAYRRGCLLALHVAQGIPRGRHQRRDRSEIQIQKK
jgi:hypothetical protein